jgi:hypothetical protein
MNDKKQDGSKKNSWKIIIVLILIFAVFKSCGNGNTCKEKGCHDELYKDGYCRTHYMLHITDEYLDDYFHPDYGK